MSGDKMTPGDKAGMEARGNGSADATPEKPESPKPKTPRELKIEGWKGKYVNPWQSAGIFAYIAGNSGAILEVTDARNPKGEKGVVYKRENALAVRVGNNIFSVADGNNEKRFKWTDKSAELLGGFEFDGEIAVAEMAIRAQTKGFIKTCTEDRSEKSVEVTGVTFSSLLRSIMGRNRSGFTVHDRDSVDKIESVYYRCSKRESVMLKALAQKEYMPVGGKDADIVFLLKDRREGDLVDLLKNVGHKPNVCLPAKIRISKKGIQFYPCAEIH